MMPFGRMLGQELGPRAANLDRVLTRQAAHLAADEMELVFAASLALRSMECVQISSD